MDWSLKWELKFNVAKCCVLHFGRTNMKNAYKIHVIQKQKRLSAKYTYDTLYINTVVKKAKRQLRIITRVFKDKSFRTIVPFGKTNSSTSRAQLLFGLFI